MFPQASGLTSLSFTPLTRLSGEKWGGEEQLEHFPAQLPGNKGASTAVPTQETGTKIAYG